MHTDMYQRLRQRLIEPSPAITEPDQRRQAALLSSFLLGIIMLGSLIEAVTVVSMTAADWKHYTGYRLTIAALALFLVLYGLSRTARVRLAAALSVIVASLAIFFTAWAVPTGALGGLLDLLIIPLWLGSLYLSMPALILLVLLDVLTLLAFPLFTPTVSWNYILSGPFSFLIVTAVLLMVITHHRNQLEQDRRTELTDKEQRSRREAARAEALLRVAERLNVQLDRDTLLRTLCEEVTRALHTPIALALLYDPEQDAFCAAAGVGLPADLIRRLSPLPRRSEGRQTRDLGSFRGLADLQAILPVPDADLLHSLHLGSLAFADMEYEGKLIGSLVAVTQGEQREFTQEELLLLQGLGRQGALAIVGTRLFEAARRQATRSQSLLRVAEHLNAELDLDTLLRTICEEVSRALDAPVSILSLYDAKQNAFRPAATTGMPPDILRGMIPFPRPLHDQAARSYGDVFTVPDLQSLAHMPNFTYFQQLDLRSLAFATMEYEGETIGNLTALTPRPARQFTGDDLLLLQGLARQAALAIVNTRLFKDAHRRLEHLQALRVIDMAINSNHDLAQTLQVLLQQITSQLGVDAAVILPVNDSDHSLEYCASTGFHTRSLRFTHLRMGEGIAGRAARQRETIFIPDLRRDPQTLASAPTLAQEGFISYLAVPLIAQGNVRGVLELFNRSALDPDAEWLNFLEALAGQAAIAMESTMLFDNLQRTNRELCDAYDSTIEGWSHALDLRDKETEGHTRRVIALTLELARAFGFREPELVHIRRGALLHDIGKMGVPDSILLKDGELTREEWEVMRRHPDLAYEMLQPIAYLRPALEIPYCHHERWDGSGYPRGLKGEAIPLTARIFAVVDVWDALTSDRPYRAAWPPAQALRYIQERAGSHFDPQVVKAFIDLMKM